MSPKHLPTGTLQEFAARHNLRDEDTIDIMAAVITGMNGKRLRSTSTSLPTTDWIREHERVRCTP